MSGTNKTTGWVFVEFIYSLLICVYILPYHIVWYQLGIYKQGMGNFYRNIYTQTWNNSIPSSGSTYDLVDITKDFH